MKQSQITIFIVLGIVILIIFGLMFFVSSQTSDLVLEKKINKIYGEFLSSTSLKDYVSSCLDMSAKNAIFLVSMQGGKIYDTQATGGYKITSNEGVIPFNYLGYTYNVGYGIKAPVPGFGENLYAPGYPYFGELVNSSPIKSAFAHYNDTGSYPYTLTALCSRYGQNYWNITNATFSCERDSILNDSIQKYMELYITEGLTRCVNFSQFTDKMTYNITEGEVSTYVLIGDFDVFVFVKYPILLTLKNEPPIIRFFDFNTRIDVRLKKIHELAMHLIGYRSSITTRTAETESDNIFFNITRDDPYDCRIHLNTRFFNESCILNGMTVSRIRDYCLGRPNNLCDQLPDHYNYTDIINITDDNSKIDGKPLMFLFAVENRIPALNNTKGNDGWGKVTLDKGENITFFALDPDEDNLIFSMNSSDFDKIGYNVFNATKDGEYNLIINVSDNEKLYDYQELDIAVN